MESYPFQFSFRNKNLRVRSSNDIVPLSYQIDYILKTENKIVEEWGDKWFSKKSKSKEEIDSFESACLNKCFKKRKEFYSYHYLNYIDQPNKISQYVKAQGANQADQI